MLAILHPNTDENSEDYRTTFQFLEELQDIQLQTHVVQGEQQKLTEIYLVGDCLLYTSPSPRDGLLSRMPSSA